MPTITKVDLDGNCSMVQYLRGICKARKVKPSKKACARWGHWERSPHYWWRIGIYWDNCTRGPDKPGGFNFIPACRMHDYGYGLVYSRYLHHSHKYKADNEFYNVLRNGTCPHYSWWKRGACRQLAYTYYQIVWFGGNPRP